VRLSDEAPIELAAKRQRPAIRVRDQVRLISTASFKQQHLGIQIGRKSRSHNRAGGARPTNYEVVMRLQVGRELLLIQPYSFREVGGIRFGHASPSGQLPRPDGQRNGRAKDIVGIVLSL